MHKCLPLTYKNKIAAVHDGTCRQTIRKGSRFKVGDEITFFTWTGKPYRSPWGYRYEARLREVFELHIFDARPAGDIDLRIVALESVYLNDKDCDYLAKLDGIEPPTKAGLIHVLDKLHGGKSLSGKWQILRW